MLRIFFLYMLVTVVINLSFDHQTSPQVSLAFTYADQHREVEVAPLDTFQIMLPMQMGNGRQWMFSASDHPELRLISQEMEDVKPLPGGMHHQIFTFQAEQSGFTMLRLTIKKHWEDSSEEEFKMFFNVTSPYAQELPQHPEMGEVALE